MDLDKFKEEFDQSGLTQKAFADLKNISSSMVSYYLRKAKLKNQLHNEATVGFSALRVSHQPLQEIKIITPAGIEIKIPV